MRRTFSSVVGTLAFLLAVCHAMPQGYRISTMSSDSCSACSAGARAVHKLLLVNETQARALDVLEAFLCGTLPRHEANFCAKAVNAYGPQLLDYLAEEFQPQAICNDLLSLECDLRSAPASLGNTTKPRLPERDDCAICTFFALDVASSVKSFESIIAITLQKACTSIGDVEGHCAAVFNASSDQLIEWLEDRFTPVKACNAIGACNASIMMNEAFSNATFQKGPAGPPPRGGPGGPPPRGGPAPSGAPPKPTSPAPSGAPPKPTSPAPSGGPPKPTGPAPSDQPPKPTGPAPSGQPPKPTGPAPSGHPPKPTGPAPSGEPPKPTGPAPSDQPPKPTGPGPETL